MEPAKAIKSLTDTATDTKDASSSHPSLNLLREQKPTQTDVLQCKQKKGVMFIFFPIVSGLEEIPIRIMQPCRRKDPSYQTKEIVYLRYLQRHTQFRYKYSVAYWREE